MGKFRASLEKQQMSKGEEKTYYYFFFFDKFKFQAILYGAFCLKVNMNGETWT